MKIGFIGLGNMGAPMAQRLAEAGHKIIGYDLMESAIAALPKDMITIANDAPDAARDQDIVITMLPDGKSLASVAAEIIPVMRKGSCLIDCSTVDVNTARTVAASAKKPISKDLMRQCQVALLALFLEHSHLWLVAA